MKLKLTAIYQKVKEGYIAYIEEIPGVNTQGKTLRETKRNLKEALQMVVESYREIMEQEIRGKKVIREELNFA